MIFLERYGVFRYIFVEYSFELIGFDDFVFVGGDDELTVVEVIDGYFYFV